MVEFTFLEVHLDNADIDGTAEATADAVTALPFSSITTDEREDEEESESEPDEVEDEDTTISLAPLATLVGLVVLAIALKKLLGSDDE